MHKVSSNHNASVCSGIWIFCFKISTIFFRCPFFFEEYINPQVRINKMVNKFNIDSFRIYLKDISSYISINLLRLYLFQKILINFLLNLYIPTWSWKNFKFMVFRFLENALSNQKIEVGHIYSCLQSNSLPHHPPYKEKLLIPSGNVF